MYMCKDNFEEEVERLAKIKVSINSRPRHKRERIDGIFHAINQNRISMEQKIYQQNQMFTENIQRIEASLDELRNLALELKHPTADLRVSIPKIPSKEAKLSKTSSIMHSKVRNSANLGHSSENLFCDSSQQLEVYSSKTADKNLLTQEVRSAVAKILPEALGLYTNHEAENCIIETLDDVQNDSIIFLQAKNQLFREFPEKITGPSRKIFHLIRSIIDNYDNRLSPEQIKSLIVSCCSSDFKDLVYRFFPENGDINESLQTIVNIYGKTPRTSKLFSKLFAITFNFKKPEASLRAVFNQIALCYPKADIKNLSELAIHHCLNILPRDITKAVIPKIISMKQLKQLSYETQSMNFPQFLSLVMDYLSTIKTSKNSFKKYTKTISEYSCGQKCPTKV